MSDHHHYAGVADENHIHTPRDIGAADEDDLEALRQEVRRLEFMAGELQKQNIAYGQRAARLESRVESMAEHIAAQERGF